MDFFDLHCDTVYESDVQNSGLASNSLAVAFDRVSHFRRWCQCFALFIPDRLRGTEAVSFYCKLRDRLFYEIEQNPHLAVPFGGHAEPGKCNVILTVESGAALGGNADNIDMLYGDGVRMMTLTWNGDNELASGILGSGGGLTRFGWEVLGRMTDLGIAADVSHLNERGFYQVAQTGIRLVASHSNLRSVHYHKRNLTDEQFSAICNSGGLVGINFYTDFLGGAEEAVFNQVYRMLELGGENHIAIGSDFDGAEICEQLSCVERMPRLVDRLSEYGLSNEIINKLMFENAHKLFSGKEDHS